MSASNELEPHPRRPQVRSSQLTAFPVRDVEGTGAKGWRVPVLRLEVPAEARAMGGCTTG